MCLNYWGQFLCLKPLSELLAYPTQNTWHNGLYSAILQSLERDDCSVKTITRARRSLCANFKFDVDVNGYNKRKDYKYEPLGVHLAES
jgi:hypothetical protein